VSFDEGTVDPNIHNAEEEEDYEGQGECGFLHGCKWSQGKGRQSTTGVGLCRLFVPSVNGQHGLCVTPCYALACRNRGQADGSTGDQAVSLRYFNSVLGGRCEEPKRVATCCLYFCPNNFSKILYENI